MLTPAAGPTRSRTQRTRRFLQGVLDHLGAEPIGQHGVHVRVNIYSSLEANGFATKPGESSGRRFLGLADDGKPIFEIGITQGILPVFTNVDQIAFLLGHELGHILSGHLQDTSIQEEILQHWYSSQANEVEADFFSLGLMKGKYELEAAVDFMERILPSGFDHDFLRDLTATHHHPSVRLGALLARIQQFRRLETRAAPRSQTPIPQGALSFFRSSRSDQVTVDFDAIRKEYLHWFDQVIAPRDDQKILYHGMWNSMSEYPLLANSDKILFADGKRALFRESLSRILARSSLSVTEKLERIFELLIIYHNVLRSLDVLTTIEIGELRGALVTLGFSTEGLGLEGRWHALTLLGEFERRTLAHNNRGPMLSRLAFIGIFTHAAIAPLFATLFRSSTPWASLRDEIFRFDDYRTLEDLTAAARQAMKEAWPESVTRPILERLASFPFSGLSAQQSGLPAMEGFFDLYLDATSSSCQVAPVCRQIAEVIERVVPELKEQLKLKLRSFLRSDPRKMSDEDLNKAFDEFYGILGVYPPGRLGPGDTSEYSERMWAWFDAALATMQLYRSVRKRTTIHDLGVLLFPHIRGGIEQGLWSRMEALRIYRVLVPMMGGREPEGEDSFFIKVPTGELKSLALEQRSRLLDDDQFVGALSTYTGISVLEIRRLGLTQTLFNQFRTSRTPTEMATHIRGHLPLSTWIMDYATDSFNASLKLQRYLLADPNIASRVLASLSHAEFEALTRGQREIEEDREILNAMSSQGALLSGRVFSPPGSCRSWVVALVDSLILRQRAGLGFDQWAHVFHNIIKAAHLEVASLSLQQRTELARFLDESLGRLPALQRPQILGRPEMLGLLVPERAAHHLLEIFVSQLPARASLEEKADCFADFQRRFDLRNRFPELNRILKSLVAERLRLQPGQIRVFLPDDAESMRVQMFSGQIRGMSAIVGRVQGLAVSDQMEFIEYVLGRQNAVPSCITQLSREIQAIVPFDNLVAGLRARLSDESTLTRALVILPLYTGGRSMLGRPGGAQALIENILRSVSPQNREMARTLAQAIITAEGKNAPLAFALIFGQRGEGNGQLDEAQILLALFNAYGVPGMKFAQYLAFTSEFEVLRRHLASTQDQAMPISYLEAMRLLEKRFPNGLPDGIQIVDIKGSGSVNIGIEYFNPATGRSEILTVARDEVETATKEDFRRLRKVIEALVAPPEGRARYGFLLGLDRIIQQSVELEFNRRQVFENHRELSRALDRRVRGWHVRMVKPHSLENGVIRMEMAQGIPAREMEQRDPHTYRDAMAAASTAMVDHLLREDGSEERDSHYFADSDFHNGQVFIDSKTKTVYLIDPGQAVAIRIQEFELAKRILRIISRTVDPRIAVDFVNGSLLNPHLGIPLISEADLALVLRSSDPADAFIKFIGMIERKGGRVPLPVVQWVLGMNRQLALSRTLGLGLEKRLFWRFVRDGARDAIVGAPGVSSRDACERELLGTLNVLRAK